MRDITRFYANKHDNESDSDPEYISRRVEPNAGGKNLLPKNTNTQLPQQKINKRLQRQQLNPLNSIGSHGELLNSGNNEELVWLNVKGSGDKNNIKYPIHNSNDYVNTEALQGLNPLQGVKVKTKQEIQYEIDAEQKKWNDLENGTRDTSADESLYEPPEFNAENDTDDIGEITHDLQDGEYILFVDNEVVLRSFSESQIIDSIESIMIDYNVQKDRLKLIRNVPITFGVNLK